MLTLFQH